MSKTIKNDTVYYAINWSPLYTYDKYSATRILPEMPGIFALFSKTGTQYRHLLFYTCWRDGLRLGMKNFLDPLMTKSKGILLKLLDLDFIYYKYAVIDSGPEDLEDILFWLIAEYQPPYNDEDFEDSGRYKNISIKENFPKE